MTALKKFQVWTVLWCSITLSALTALPVQAATPADVPLFLTVNVAPNLVMTMDDSGSMGWGYIPDSIRSSSAKMNGPRFSAASYNGMYYDPKTNYPVPTRSDGVSYSTSFTNAWVNGFDTSRGSADLSANGYRPIYDCYPEEGIDWSSCLKVPGMGAVTSTKTVTYTYKGCTVFFDDRNKNNDRIYVDKCTPSMPFDGDGSPSDADGGAVTVSGAGSYSGTYAVGSSSDGGKNWNTRINLNTKNDFSKDSTINNVSFTWEVTSTTTTSAAAYYHLFYKDKPGVLKPAKCNDDPETDACYILIQVGESADITPGSSAEQKQNFANWYSFYRSRALSAISATMSAVTGLQDGQLRLGWQTLNGCTSFGTGCLDYNNTKRENRLRDLTTSHRTNFYNWLARYPIGGGTPLRSAINRAGSYYKTSGVNSPYAEDPYVSKGTELSCRKNFHIMVTDGVWNEDSNVNFGGNIDSTNHTLPDGVKYTPRYPYRNEPGSPPSGYSYSNSLADIAFYYWLTDLRTDLSNNVVPNIIDRSGTAEEQYWNPKNNPANWQNMATYTIGMGLSSVLQDPAWGGSTYAGDYADLASGAKFWPEIDESPSSSEDGHVYDLWHAAINGRGQFFSADNPASTNSAFKAALTSVLNANPSSAALAANSTSIQTGTIVYQARFDSKDWHGEFLAFPVQGNGTIGAQLWDAGKLMPDAASRNIFTFNGKNGVEFSSCATLGADQKLALDKDAALVTDNRCTDRLAWLRGDAGKEERNGGNLRNRISTILGDIINSDPAFSYNEDLGYGGSTVSMTGASSYKSFVTSKKNRPPMVYVGGNDGMLHGFRADIGHANSGREIMAYVPAGVYNKLSKLTAPNYSHQYLVDGSPSVGDVYIKGNWESVLVAGLGAGGKSIYALNISDPGAFADTDVMWEFTDSTDLGYTYSQPQIARLHNGQWAAIFGNGYESTSGKAFLYVVNISDGSLMAKIPAGSTTGNGMSTPVLYDTDNDKVIDYIYAGDLKGNLWKFDLTGSTPSSWGVFNSGAPLFSAKDASGSAQPITSQPKVGPNRHGGVLVYFGTGSYFSTTDANDSSVQSFYAIWDNGVVVSKSNLQVQTIDKETTEYGADVRDTSKNTVNYTGGQRGWYMDLISPKTGRQGERVVSTPLLKYNRVIFTTLIPSTDPCKPGGETWIMELDFDSGGRTDISSFDFNIDGLYDDKDLLASGNTASGVKSTVGIAKTPTWLEGKKGSDFKEISGSSGNIMTLNNRGAAPTGGPVQRIYWRQIL